MASLALFNEGVPAHFFHLVEAPTMRLPNVKMLLCRPSRCIFMALFEITHFWSNLIACGYQCTLPLYHAFVIDMVIAMEAPTMRLSNVKMLLCRPSRCIFMALFEIAHFWSNSIACGYQCTLPLYHAFVIDMVIAMEHGIPASSESQCLL